jgi:O-antigen/teichoic acid export membrane protein
VLLGAMRTPEEVGLFRIAMSAANMTLFGLTVVNFVVAPTFARLNADMERAEMALTAQRAAAVSLGAALPIALVLLLAGPQILGLLYGEGFAAAYMPMAVLVAAQMVNGFFGSCGNVLNMTGNERHAARALIVALVVNAGLNVILVPLLGGTGAALATLASTLTWNLLMDLAVRRELGFTSSALPLFKRPRSGV